MKHIFKHKRISAIVSVVPREEYRFDDEYPLFKLTDDKARRFKKMIGLDRHRIAPPEVCSSDLCLYGLQQLLKEGTLKREDIGALLFVSQTPDYFAPPTSNVLHGKLGLGPDVVCLDINQGCAGFAVGLMQAFLLLEITALPKVVLLNGDTGSKQVDRCNRISYPLTGDAGSVTIVERCEAENPIYMDVKNDGSRHKAILIPGGAYRTPASPETLVIREVEEGMRQNLHHVSMDGAAIFNFTMEDVPRQVQEVLAFSGDSLDSIEYFLFHQPNAFILQQMAAKMKIPPAKMPNNIVTLYGNSSSTTIPLVISHNYPAEFLRAQHRVCVSGFGVGLAWLTMVMTLGPLTTCRLVEYEPV
ncbi:MAG TPA: ketoacyl-ACP synthase III [Verrucomicrobiae bacterium]|nr:ketoacyl-ACP synthase III [Verrucomicrobiae bacterium]